eukprot:g8666.t1
MKAQFLAICFLALLVFAFATEDVVKIGDELDVSTGIPRQLPNSRHLNQKFVVHRKVIRHSKRPWWIWSRKHHGKRGSIRVVRIQQG